MEKLYLSFLLTRTQISDTVVENLILEDCKSTVSTLVAFYNNFRVPKNEILHILSSEYLPTPLASQVTQSRDVTLSRSPGRMEEDALLMPVPRVLQRLVGLQ